MCSATLRALPWSTATTWCCCEPPPCTPGSEPTALTIALSGATGFVGQAVLDVAARKGLAIRALARKVPEQSVGSVEWVQGDLGDRNALDRLVDGASCVIHVAALTNAPDVAQFEQANVHGTLELLEASLKAGVPRFVFVSSLSAREPDLSAYGASKAKAEKIVAASGLDWTIVRPPAVYGPRDRDMLEIFRAAKFGVVPMPPAGRASMIHVDDLARLLLALILGGEDVTHKVFEPDDGHLRGWSHHEMAKAIGWAMGRRPFVLHLSRPMLERAAAVDGFIRRGKARLTRDRVSYMSHPDWVVAAERRVPQAVWQPRIPTLEGLKATATWYRRNGWL